MSRHEHYARLRRQVGTQEEVASMLGVTASTMAKREQGERTVRAEHIYALKGLIAEQAVRMLGE